MYFKTYRKYLVNLQFSPSYTRHLRRGSYLSLILILLGCQKAEDTNTLFIATAANMQFAMKEIVESFEIQTGIPAEVVISSSGKLTAQIKEGAPFDVFVSANMKYPETLHQQGYTTTGPIVYAYGQLVLWTIKEEKLPGMDFKAKHVALANPKNAPYGRAAIEVLEHYDLYEELKDKLVYGESIAQTNQFIVSKAAEMGFTAKSVVLSPEMKGKGQYVDIPSELYTPIAQGIVLVKSSTRMTQAQQFYQFLFSETGQAILQHYGYLIPDKINISND